MLCLLERPSQLVNFNIISEDDTSLMLIWCETENIKGEVDYYIVSITLFMMYVINIATMLRT